MKKRASDSAGGFLILLLLILTPLFMREAFSKHGSYEGSCGENEFVRTDVISPFHKVTLRIPISLNKEPEEGLRAIPGIGPKLAAVIVRERDKRGGFKDLSEIKTLHGIGDKIYKKIAPYLKL